MKKRLLILLTFMLFSPFVVNAEEIKLVWQKNYGGSGLDKFNSAISTDDGGVVVVGDSISNNLEGITNQGSTDAIIVKYDNDGNLVWQKNYGGDDLDSFTSVISTDDGGFVTVGYSISTNIEGIKNQGHTDAIIVKYDKDGNLVWQKNYGGGDSDYFNSVVSTDDGGFVVIGYSSSTNIEGITNRGSFDAIIIKYDKDGNLLWQKNYGGSGLDNFNSVVSTPDESVIITCTSASTNIEGLQNKSKVNPIVVKYDKDGELLWQKAYSGNSSDNYDSVIFIENGGFIVAGSIQSTDIEGIINKGGQDGLIMKFDKEGNIIWLKNYGGDSHDEFNSVVKLKNSRFVVIGNSLSTNIEGLKCMGYDSEDVCHDAIILGYDNDGKLMWQKNYGGSDYDYFNSVIQLKNGDIVLVGHSFSKDIEGVTNKGGADGIIVKYSIEYNLENINTEKGNSTVEQKGYQGIITPTPNEGYEVDKIIVKDKEGNVLDVEVVKLQDGTYSFELYDDVTVEVLFKEIIENPKTGVSSIIGLLFTITLCFISGLFILRKYNERYEF